MYVPYDPSDHLWYVDGAGQACWSFTSARFFPTSDWRSTTTIMLQNDAVGGYRSCGRDHQGVGRWDLSAHGKRMNMARPVIIEEAQSAQSPTGLRQPTAMQNPPPLALTRAGWCRTICGRFSTHGVYRVVPIPRSLPSGGAPYTVRRKPRQMPSPSPNRCRFARTSKTYSDIQHAIVLHTRGGGAVDNIIAESILCATIRAPSCHPVKMV